MGIGRNKAIHLVGECRAGTIGLGKRRYDCYFFGQRTEAGR